jgi:predicted RNase H-like HicB family nuclease
MATVVKSYTFKIAIEPDEYPDGRPAYHAYVPALPGCRTWAATYEEVLHNIQEATELVVEDMLSRGEKLPERSDENVEVSPEPRVTIRV